MKILVIGSGGREHALCWSISKSPLCKKIYCLPGNAGIKEEAECVNIKIDNHNAIIKFIKQKKIDFVVVGPEQPLVDGLVDKINKLNTKVFGPSKKAAILENSKSFTKDFCKKYNIPTARYKKFKNYKLATTYLKKSIYPIVIKVSGLASGKGVYISRNKNQALKALKEIMIKKKFKQSGNEIIIEEFLDGEEISFLALVDGNNYLPLLTSQDHKKVFEKDKGPNTGGMGAYCPVPFIKKAIQKKITKTIIEPTILAMKNEGRIFKGILYAGLMLKKNKIYLIEFNVRFGDPECQSLIYLLESDLLKVLLACANGKLKDIKLRWKKGYAFTVVMTNKGYPNKFKKNAIINKLDDFNNHTKIKIFHSGTILDKKNNLIAVEGRVLSVTSYNKNFSDVKKETYKAVKKIKWKNSYYRKDIGWRITKFK